MRGRRLACALLASSSAFYGCGGASSNRDNSAAGTSAAGSGGSGATGGMGGSAPQGCDADVQFASPVVETAVRQRLVEPDGPLSGTALAGITDLLIPESAGDVAALDGVECLVGLRVLGIPPGSLESLAPLSNLGQLRNVSFPDNRVTSLAPLSDKPELRTISASGNAITSVGDLTLAAQECGRLDLTGNPLTDAAQDDLQRFCESGWLVSSGEAGMPTVCNEQCLPRP